MISLSEAIGPSKGFPVYIFKLSNIFFLIRWPDVWQAYSRMGLQIVLYATVLVRVLAFFNERINMYSDLLAFLHVSTMCVLKERWLSITTPKYLAWSTVLRPMLFKVYVGTEIGSFDLRDILRCSHLETLNFIWELTAQLCILLRSSCRSSLSLSLLIRW